MAEGSWDLDLRVLTESVGVGGEESAEEREYISRSLWRVERSTELDRGGSDEETERNWRVREGGSSTSSMIGEGEEGTGDAYELKEWKFSSDLSETLYTLIPFLIMKLTYHWSGDCSSHCSNCVWWLTSPHQKRFR